MSDGAWVVKLEDIGLEGGGTLPSGAGEIVGCLTAPPDGLGLPPLRIEDESFPQRDGVQHYADWYEPRIITLSDVTVSPDNGCSSCPSAREKMAALLEAWSRKCDDTELVIFTDCHGTEPPTGGTGAITGPFGVRGRPRVANHIWLPGRSKSAIATLRFDAVDHRLYLLNSIGTPGSGTQCHTLTLQLAGAAYSAVVVGDSPADYWRLNEPVHPGPTGADNTGTPGTNNMISAEDTLNTFGLDPLAPGLGTSARLNNGSASSISSTSRTVEMWYQNAPGPEVDANFIWSRSTPFSFVQQIVSPATSRIEWNSTQHQIGATLADIIFDENPHHVVVTAPNPDLRLYVDRELVLTLGGAGTTAIPTGSFFLSPTLEYNHRYSDVALYSAAITQTQVEEHYDAAVTPTTEEVIVDGNVCVPVTVTLEGPLTNPRVASGETYVGYSGTIASGDTVVIDTENGTAVLLNSLGYSFDAVDHITGDPYFTLNPGSNEVLFSAYSGSGSGEICWRPAVMSA